MDEMMSEMQKASGDLSAYQSDLANAQTQKSQLESDLSTAQNQLVTAEKDKAAMIEKKRKFENDLGSFKKDIEDMEIAITRAEQVRRSFVFAARNVRMTSRKLNCRRRPTRTTPSGA